MEINIKVSRKFISSLWASKFPTRLILSLLMGMIKHSQITQSKKFAISLKYLKKEVRNGGHFWCADKRQTQLTFACSKSTIETLKKGVKYVQK